MSRSDNPFAPLVTASVRGLRPYVPGKPIEALRRERGLGSIVKLASNENPLGPSPAAVKAAAVAVEAVHRYPDGYGFDLKAAIGRLWGLGPQQVFLGNGSSEVIEMTVRLLVRPGCSVVLASPSFSIYELTVTAQGGRVLQVPLTEHGVNLDAVADAVEDDTTLVILGNPNNPTGTVFGRQGWERFLSRVPPRVGVLLDEAYAEYGEDLLVGRDYLCDDRPLVVARTFSKAYGIAGMRIGYGLAAPGFVDYLDRLRLPFNANGPAQAAARAALEDDVFLDRSRKLNRTGLERLYRAFEGLGLPYVPSQANFVVVEVGDGDRVYEALLDRGVIVRSARGFGMPEWIRVTVGRPEEIDRFVAALAEVVGGGEVPR